MIIEKEIQINKNIAEAWKVLGTEFANAHVWASSLSHSEGSGGKFNGSECSERSCDIKGFGSTGNAIHGKICYQYLDLKFGGH